jgi:hypothetical protein
MTNTEAVEPTPRKQISIPVPSLKLSRLAQLIAVTLAAVAVTSAAFLLWGPHNPIQENHNAYKAPGGTLVIDRETGLGAFTPYANPQYVYSTVSPGSWKCLSDKGYSGVQAPFGMAAQIILADPVDYYACS